MIIAIEYLTYLFFIIFPFFNIQSFLYGGSATRSMLLYLFTGIFGLIFAFFLFKKKSNLEIPKSPGFLALVVYFIFLIISSWQGLNFNTSFWSLATRTTGLWYFANLGLLMFILWHIFRSDIKKQNRLILITIISTAFYSLLSFLGPEGLNWIFKNYRGGGFTFGNSSFAGMYLFGSFLLSVYNLVQTESRKWWMYILPFLLIINPYILNRGIWFGDFSQGLLGDAKTTSYVTLFSILGLVVFWFVSKIKNSKIKSRISYSLFVFGLVIMFLSVYSLLSSGGYLRQVYLNQATAVRPLTWGIAERAIWERPYLGWGVDNFERVFESNFDNRVLQDEYGNEAWLDRAHNIVIDQSVDSGLVGFSLYSLAYLTIILSLVYTALNSSIKSDRILAMILTLYFPLHFVELQTAFDTSISYPLFALMATLSVIVFGRAQKIKNKQVEWVIGGNTKYVLAILLAVFCVWSLFWGLVPYVRAQLANSALRSVGSAAERLPLYPLLLGSLIDQHAFLWRTSTDFQRGVLENPKVLEDQKMVDGLKKEILVYEEYYRQYLKNNPSHFRAHLNLADILIYQRLFEVNKLEEAQKVLDRAIELVPQSPQSYWMKAVAYVYMGEFDLAREFAKKGLDLNPKIKESQSVVEYVERSIKTFPEIDLYLFRQT